jgi:hypothetical protein
VTFSEAIERPNLFQHRNPTRIVASFRGGPGGRSLLQAEQQKKEWEGKAWRVDLAATLPSRGTADTSLYRNDQSRLFRKVVRSGVLLLLALACDVGADSNSRASRESNSTNTNLLRPDMAILPAFSANLFLNFILTCSGCLA